MFYNIKKELESRDKSSYFVITKDNQDNLYLYLKPITKN